MRKVFFALFFFSSLTTFSQTWVEVDRNGNRCDATVITREQYRRLLNQYEETRSYCRLEYLDALELGSAYRVTSGNRPSFTNYYYILIRQSSSDGDYNVLVYGHPNTGRMELHFINWNPMFGYLGVGGIEINSNKYKIQYNQFNSWVNGFNGITVPTIRTIPNEQYKKSEFEKFLGRSIVYLGNKYDKVEEYALNNFPDLYSNSKFQFDDNKLIYFEYSYDLFQLGISNKQNFLLDTVAQFNRIFGISGEFSYGRYRWYNVPYFYVSVHIESNLDLLQVIIHFEDLR